MSRRPPNILLLFTDQQRYDTIAALGNPVMVTPALDRLVRQGTAFTSAYTPSPVCVAARCSLLYGQHPHHTGCYDNSVMPTDGRQSFAAALTAAGYRTHAIGKCHHTPDPRDPRGYATRETQEEMVGHPDDDDYLRFLREHGFAHVHDPHGVRGPMYYVPQVAQMPAALHPTQWVGDRAVDFVRSQEGRREPWMLFSSFIHPHPPFSPPVPWNKLYNPTLMPLPDLPPDSAALQTYVNRHQNRYKYRDRGFDLNLVRAIKAHYYGCISFIDLQVGRILDALDQSGQAEDTLVLFTCDHGEMLGDRYCFGKRSMHDASSRIPLIARWPARLAADARCDVPVSLVDIAPTLMRAGTQIRSHEMDGEDLLAVAGGRSTRQVVYAHHAVAPFADAEERARRSSYMAVSRRFKYFYSAPDDREFFFDRLADPRERQNLAGVPALGEAKMALRDDLIGHLRAGGEVAGLAEDGWRSFPRLEMPVDPDAGLIEQNQRWAERSIPGYTVD
jgi:arylsulfatase